MRDHLVKLLVALEKAIPPVGLRHHTLALAFDPPLTTMRLTLFRGQSPDILIMEEAILRFSPEKFVEEVRLTLEAGKTRIVLPRKGLYTGFPRTESKFSRYSHG